MAAGKTRDVTINLPPSAFQFFDRTNYEMDVSKGVCEILYGTSSDNKDLKTFKVTIE